MSKEITPESAWGCAYSSYSSMNIDELIDIIRIKKFPIGFQEKDTKINLKNFEFSKVAENPDKYFITVDGYLWEEQYNLHDILAKIAATLEVIENYDKIVYPVNPFDNPLALHGMLFSLLGIASIGSSFFFLVGEHPFLSAATLVTAIFSALQKEKVDSFKTEMKIAMRTAFEHYKTRLQSQKGQSITK